MFEPLPAETERLATIIRNFNSPWVVVGGVADHVHLLFDMGKLHVPVEHSPGAAVASATLPQAKVIMTFGHAGFATGEPGPTLLLTIEWTICSTQKNSNSY